VGIYLSFSAGTTDLLQIGNKCRQARGVERRACCTLSAILHQLKDIFDAHSFIQHYTAPWLSSRGGATNALPFHSIEYSHNLPPL